MKPQSRLHDVWLISWCFACRLLWQEDLLMVAGELRYPRVFEVIPVKFLARMMAYSNVRLRRTSCKQWRR